MKKMILAAAIVCAAAVTQASTVIWGLASGTTVDKTAYASGTAYLICTESLAKASFTDADAAAAWYKANSSSLAGKALLTGSVTDGAIYQSDSKDEAIGRKSYWLVIVAGDEKNFAVSTTTKALNITTSTLNVSALWNGSSAAGAQMTSFATTSVPEPTSGLMLLLGVAGLALKRKRA